MEFISTIFLTLCFGGIFCIEDSAILRNETPKGDESTTANGTDTTAGNWTSGEDTDGTTPPTPVLISPVDLAHILDNDMETDPFTFNKSSLDPTIGTHIIAPCMYNKESFCAQNIPLKSLNAPAVVLDMRSVVWNNATARITDTDIIEWEKNNGIIQNGYIVLFQTGWSRFWSNTSAYRGSDSIDPTKFVYPDIDVSVANWLVTGRNFTGVGIDTYSLERGESTEVHEILANNSMFVVENLVNLDYLGSRGTLLTVVPLKVLGAGAAPCGVIAMVQGHPELHPPPTTPEPTTTIVPSANTALTKNPGESTDSNVIPDYKEPSQKSSKLHNSSNVFLPANLLMLLSCIFLGIISLSNERYLR